MPKKVSKSREEKNLEKFGPAASFISSNNKTSFLRQINVLLVELVVSQFAPPPPSSLSHYGLTRGTAILVNVNDLGVFFGRFYGVVCTLYIVEDATEL